MLVVTAEVLIWPCKGQAFNAIEAMRVSAILDLPAAESAQPESMDAVVKTGSFCLQIFTALRIEALKWH